MGVFDAAEGRPTAEELADAMVAFVAAQIEALVTRHAPNFELPRVFAGHLVGQDAKSDLAFTLGLLHAGGCRELAGRSVEDAAWSALHRLDGPSTNTFFSYRAAETVERLGGFHGNPRVESSSEPERNNLLEAFDSTESVPLVRAGKLPKNYAVVLARCEHARRRLGLIDDTELLAELCGRCRDLMAPASEGWIDDSNEGRGQFDIYTPDVFLFAEPLADELGSIWRDGLRGVLRDLDALALPGGAVVWGRSIGALGLAMTIELGAIGAARKLVDEPGAWIARAAWGFEALRSWFEGGVIRAHQYRSTMFYRGPQRRLQMTLDVLAKLVQAALELRRCDALRAAPPFDAWRDVDRVVYFDPPSAAKRAGAWAHRARSFSLVLPFVDGFSSDYLPAPRSPGLFEHPTSGPISMTPVVHAKGRQLVAAGRPVALVPVEHGVRARYSGFSHVGAGPGEPPALRGSRHASFRVEGRSLWVEEEITIEDELDAVDVISLQVPEVAGRRLNVAFECDAPHRSTVVDVSGLAEYRSFWNEQHRVHQIEVDAVPQIVLRWRATPQLRVRSTAQEHPYNVDLYGPIRDRVTSRQAHPQLVDDPRALDETDVLHMHWPEWWRGPDVEWHRGALGRLRDARVPIVWTQHNLAPHHFRGDEGREIYRLWAKQAAAVIHHTEWGRAEALRAYEYGEHTIHEVISHGHWGGRHAVHALADRADVEARLGLPPCTIRLGLIGAPRIEKDVQLVLDAFAACSRDDLQLYVVCIDGETVPDDPRIVAIENSHVPEHVYQQRLVAMDALIFPFTPGMLMTGTAFDAIGAGKAALVSDWPVLHEVFGDAAIHYGQTADDLTRCLDALTIEQVEASKRAMAACRARSEWRDLGERTLALFERVAEGEGGSWT